MTNGNFTLNGGAIFTLRRAPLPFVALYICVEDIHEKAKLIRENGGLIVDPPAELVPNEWLCLFNEPWGVTFGMIQTPLRYGVVLGERSQLRMMRVIRPWGIKEDKSYTH
jgi:hypothetical protein